MKTQIRKLEDQSIVIAFEGLIDFESQDPLRDQLFSILEEVERSRQSGARQARCYFDFEGLEFVGSSGISHLLHTLREFNDRASEPPLYLNVKKEFRMLIRAFGPEERFSILNDEPIVPRGHRHRPPMDQ